MRGVRNALFAFLAVVALSGAPLAPVADSPARAQEPAPAPVTLTLSGDKVVGPYKLARFSVQGVPPGFTILWDVYPTNGGIANVDAATQKLKSVYEFVGPPDSYRVRVRAFKGEEVLEAWASVVIGTPPVPPAPPTPPAPVPPAPVPVDQFTKDVQAAYATETDPRRQEYALKLAAVYRAAAAKGGAVDDPNVKTVGDLASVMVKASRNSSLGLPADVIPSVRATIARRLDQPASLGIDSAKALDRELARKELQAVADALTVAANVK